jgi:glycosyltransferase involved in cell wall biosynthesis
VILESLRYLPSNFSVRLVGRFPTGESINSVWLDEYKRDPGLNKRIEFRDPVPIEQVAAEIDSCDILVQPASGDILNTNFEAPLKSFDYMVRGKPIVAADVPCHRELYTDGVNALLYDTTAEDLALKIKTLAGDSHLASTIACGAWEQSVGYNYLSRAEKILSLINNSKQRI